MKLKLQTLGRSDGFNKLMSSLISILVGLLVGGIVVLIVGLVEPKITGSGIWDGIRLIFGGILSTGRDAAGTLTWGFNAQNIGNMLFRATPLIMTGLSVAIAFKTGLFNIGAPGQYLMGTLASLSIALGIPSTSVPAGIIWVLALLGGMLAGVAGMLFGMKYTVYPQIGVITNKSFVAAVFGGLGSLPGAVIGSILLGLIETFGAGYIASNYRDLIAFSLLIVVLVIKPSGIMGKITEDKA